MNETIETILKRRSCRKYLQKPISDLNIMRIIECGLSAPSGMNEQPWFIVAVKNKNIINTFSEDIRLNFLKSDVVWRKKWAEEKNFHAFYKPPIVFMIFGKNSQWAKIDCAIAVENMVLAAESLGLSSCIIGEVSWINYSLLNKNIKVPKEYEIVLGLSVGYAKKPNKNKRKVNEKKFLIMEQS